MLVLALGVVFFLKLAYDRGWVPIEGRFAIGLLGGLGLFVLGDTMRRWRLQPAYPQIIAAGGATIAYATLYVAWVLPEYRAALHLSLPVVVAGLAAVSALLGAYSVWRNLPVLAGVSVGLTALLVAPAGDFSTVGLLFVGLLTSTMLLAAAWRGWGTVVLTGLIAVNIAHIAAAQAQVPWTLVAAMATLVNGLAVLAAHRDRSTAHDLPRTAAALAAVFLFVDLGLAFQEGHRSDPLGWAALATGLLALAAAALSRRLAPSLAPAAAGLLVAWPVLHHPEDLWQPFILACEAALAMAAAAVAVRLWPAAPREPDPAQANDDDAGPALHAKPMPWMGAHRLGRGLGWVAGAALVVGALGLHVLGFDGKAVEAPWQSGLLALAIALLSAVLWSPWRTGLPTRGPAGATGQGTAGAPVGPSHAALPPSDPAPSAYPSAPASGATGLWPTYTRPRRTSTGHLPSGPAAVGLAVLAATLLLWPIVQFSDTRMHLWLPWRPVVYAAAALAACAVAAAWPTGRPAARVLAAVVAAAGALAVVDAAAGRHPPHNEPLMALVAALVAAAAAAVWWMSRDGPWAGARLAGLGTLAYLAVVWPWLQVTASPLQALLVAAEAAAALAAAVALRRDAVLLRGLALALAAMGCTSLAALGLRGRIESQPWAAGAATAALCAVALWAWWLARARADAPAQAAASEPWVVASRWTAMALAALSPVLLFAFLLDGWAIAVGWAGLAVAFTVAGQVRGEAEVQVTSLALFGLVLGHIFLVDLRQLDLALRALTFVLTGGLLLFGAFLYARQRKAQGADGTGAAGTTGAEAEPLTRPPGGPSS